MNEIAPFFQISVVLLFAVIPFVSIFIYLFFNLYKNRRNDKPMIFETAYLQGLGNRDFQQDSFGYFEKKESGEMLAIVADGIGGMQNGETASKLTVDSIINHYTSHPEKNPHSFLKCAVQYAEQAVDEYIEKSATDCGSTVVATLLKGSKMYFASVGDSSIFHISGNNIKRINTHHNYARFLDERAKMGDITAEEAANNPHRGSLTSYIGMGDGLKTEVSSHPVSLKNNDIVLLCSDGIYKSLGDDIILKSLQAESVQTMADTLKEAVEAQNLKSQDNYTAIIVICRIK